MDVCGAILHGPAGAGINTCRRTPFPSPGMKLRGQIMSKQGKKKLFRTAVVAARCAASARSVCVPETHRSRSIFFHGFFSASCLLVRFAACAFLFHPSAYGFVLSLYPIALMAFQCGISDRGVPNLGERIFHLAALRRGFDGMKQKKDSKYASGEEEGRRSKPWLFLLLRAAV